MITCKGYLRGRFVLLFFWKIIEYYITFTERFPSQITLQFHGLFRVSISNNQ